MILQPLGLLAGRAAHSHPAIARARDATRAWLVRVWIGACIASAIALIWVRSNATNQPSGSSRCVCGCLGASAEIAASRVKKHQTLDDQTPCVMRNGSCSFQSGAVSETSCVCVHGKSAASYKLPGHSVIQAVHRLPFRNRRGRPEHRLPFRNRRGPAITHRTPDSACCLAQRPKRRHPVPEPPRPATSRSRRCRARHNTPIWFCEHSRPCREPARPAGMPSRRCGSRHTHRPPHAVSHKATHAARTRNRGQSGLSDCYT